MGSTVIISKGKSHNVLAIDGFVAETGSIIDGYIFFKIDGSECEIVLLDSFRQKAGIGSVLVRKLADMAKEHKVKRVFVITTNDNTYAFSSTKKRF
jgi:N-acetylglutamate synthase-like GNAT family acetyltransferase